MSRRKGLSAEDSELWAFVTREVIPLKRRRRKLAKAATKAADTLPEPAAPPVKPAVKPKSAASRPAKPPAAPPIAPIDKRERRQVVRGTRAIDARIGKPPTATEQFYRPSDQRDVGKPQRLFAT